MQEYNEQKVTSNVVICMPHSHYGLGSKLFNYSKTENYLYNDETQA